MSWKRSRSSKIEIGFPKTANVALFLSFVFTGRWILAFFSGVYLLMFWDELSDEGAW
jgi:hypothetical protein